MTKEDAEPQPGSERVYWLVFGAAFSITAFGLIIVTFVSGDGSCDRWTLLQYVLPIFPGIAAGAFAGAMSAKGKVGQLAVAATGGFAVWFISLLVIGVPDRCKMPRISHFQLFENAEVVGDPGHQYPKFPLKPKEGAFDVSDPAKFVFFFGVVISNIYVGAERDIDLAVRVIGIGSNGKEAWTESDHYDSLDSWRKEGLGARFTPAEIERQLGIGDTSRDGRLILAWAIGCLTPKELAVWNGTIRIAVTDHKYRSAQVDKFLSLAVKPPQLASRTEMPACAEN